MTKQEKVAALQAVAQAFYARDPYLQYDQLSMDRLLRITPRRRKTAAPEDATAQCTLYLDCSSFVWAVYYNAFGYALEADLSWEMIDLVLPRVFYYERTHPETEDERAQIATQARATLELGDLIVYEKKGNGHVMLYINEGMYIHCCPRAGSAGSYNYVARHDTTSKEGGLSIDDISFLFTFDPNGRLGRNYLFGTDIKRFCILRPLDKVGVPTAQTRARLMGCKELVCGVETSHPGGRTAEIGSTVEYVVRIRNLSHTETKAVVSFAAPQGCKLLSAERTHLCLLGSAEATAHFRIRINACPSLLLESPAITVNGFPVSAPHVRCGHMPSAAEIACLVAEAKAHILAGMSPMEAVSKAYHLCGIFLPADPGEMLATLFYRHDSVAGSVLSRKPQDPMRDFSVPSYFGGYGVITPEVACNGGVRTTQIRRFDLQPGDLLLCSDDAQLREAYACFYTGESLIGVFGVGESTTIRMGAELDAFLSSLLGRFCFALLRPYLAD